MKRTAIALGLAAAIALPGAAMAKPGNGHGHGNSATAHAEHGDLRRDRDMRHDRDNDDRRDRIHRSSQYNGQACPPGLARKSPRCVPPGQWKKGDRLPSGWDRQYTAYGSLPAYYRDRYAVNDGYRYIYRNDRVYVVDAVTRAILDVIGR